MPALLALGQIGAEHGFVTVGVDFHVPVVIIVVERTGPSTYQRPEDQQRRLW